MSLLDDVMPEYEFAQRVAIPTHAAPASILRALHEVTLPEMPLASGLAAIRYLPARLLGRMPAPSKEPFLEQLLRGGNVILAELRALLDRHQAARQLRLVAAAARSTSPREAPMKAWCMAAVLSCALLATADARAQLGEESFEGTGLPLTSLRSETGFSYMNLSFDPSVLHVPAASGGIVTGTALDVRVLSMVLGARLRVHELVDYQAWQLGSSIGFRIPIGQRLLVGADASFGYVRVASFNARVDGAPSGTFVGVGGNVDWFFQRWLSAGAVLDVELLFMERNGAHGIGLSTSLGPRVALHF